MNVVLTAKCCGKSSIKKTDKYCDLDLFGNIYPHNIEAVKDIMETYAKNHNDERIYFLNIYEYFKYRFNEIKELNVIRIILPEMSEENLNYRRLLFKRRDERKYGFCREKEYELLETKYKESWKLAAEHFPDIEIEPLRIGKFVYDIFSK